uniref:Uncharacterized protein n=1 Tax=Octopus bimaculoides TaxID=37653 RepID=A0A0L8HVY7_OCTBM
MIFSNSTPMQTFQCSYVKIYYSLLQYERHKLFCNYVLRVRNLFSCSKIESNSL